MIQHEINLNSIPNNRTTQISLINVDSRWADYHSIVLRFVHLFEIIILN